MFTAKKTQLFEAKQKTSVVVATTNTFLTGASKKSAETLSGNGALKYSTTGNSFVDQFGVIGSYKKPRTFQEIERDFMTLWGENKLMCVIFTFYLRMITRIVSLFNGEKTSEPQKGAEMKHEAIMRMIILHTLAPVTFWKNIGIFISIGSWKDIITMLQYDLVYNGWKDRALDWDMFGNLILSGLENKNTSELLKKYLPTIRSNNACKTVEAQADNIIAKWISSLLFGTKGDESGSTYKRYRKLKSSGTAHEWQQLISRKQFDRIDFSKIHGRALHLLVKSKFLKNQGLSEKYSEWITAPETKDVKYTGFVHELFEPYAVADRNSRLTPVPYTSLDKNLVATVDKQFTTLVAKAGEKPKTKLIVVRDTSGSMQSTCSGTNMRCYDIAKALALYFSEFLEGTFAGHWIEFNYSAQLHQWRGNTPTEKWYNDHTDCIGSTNFQSVVDLFCTMKRNGVVEAEFPTGILCISDNEFNPTALGKTNVGTALEKLRRAGFSQEYISNFVIVLWNLQSNAYGPKTGQKFETYGDVKNVFYFSGYSASVVSFLDDKIKTASELFEAAMAQEALQLIEL